jgi:LPS-assembly lipoprotein
MNVSPRVLLILFLSALILGCGFRLRGTDDAPTWLKPGIAIRVEGNAKNWERYLKNSFEASHIRVITPPEKAPYALIIENETLDKNIISVSSSTTPRQYQLTYTAYFRLETKKGKKLIPSSSVIVTRPLTINNDRVLGSRNEGEKLKTEMKRDAALKIIERIYQEKSPGFKAVRKTP